LTSGGFWTPFNCLTLIETLALELLSGSQNLGDHVWRLRFKQVGSESEVTDHGIRQQYQSVPLTDVRDWLVGRRAASNSLKLNTTAPRLLS
jgi:hypothetical protein